MKRSNLFFYFAITIFICGLIVLGYGIIRWISYSPELELAATKEVKELKPPPNKASLHRNQTRIHCQTNPFTLSGEEIKEVSTENSFDSKLVLKGTIIGPEKTAVLTVKEHPQESYLAKEGDIILQERIVTIKQGQVILSKDGKLLTLYQEK